MTITNFKEAVQAGILTEVEMLSFITGNFILFSNLKGKEFGKELEMYKKAYRIAMENRQGNV